MAAGTMIVEVPTTVSPVKGGLLAHVDPVTVAGSRILAGAEYDPPLACVGTQEIPDWCADPRGEKSFTTSSWEDTDTFTGYVGVACGPFGGGDESGKAERTLRRSIGFAAEQALVGKIAGSAQVPTRSPVPVLAGVGLAERLAAVIPGGHIYVSRSLVPFLGGQVRNPGDDGVLFTKQGTPLVNMIFQSHETTIDGITPTAGQTWILVTGQPRVWLGEEISVSTQELQLNDWYSLAEQVGAVGFDCKAFAILVSAL